MLEYPRHEGCSESSPRPWGFRKLKTHLGDTEVGELSLELIKLLGEVRLGLGLLPKLVALNLGH